MICGDGIGLGHASRTRLVADDLASRGHQVLVLASGGARFASGHERITVAPIPQLLSGPEDRAYLDGLLTEFGPDLITEDTGTRPDLRALDGFAVPPKVLILRRIDGFGLERYRRAGTFAYYQRTLLLSSAESLLSQPTVLPVTRRAMRASRRFRYLGPVYRTPAPAEVADAAARYRVEGARLVVVTAGGGGGHGSDDYCERLYDSASCAAALLRDEFPVKFVIVTGPLYGSTVPRPAPDVQVVTYEPALHALLHAADVAVIRPGANVLFEALSGPARLVVVPSLSYFEDQVHEGQVLQDSHGAVVASAEPDDLAAACRRQLAAGPADVRWRAPSAHHAVAEALVAEAEAGADRGACAAGRTSGDGSSQSVFFLLSRVPPGPGAVPFPHLAGPARDRPGSVVTDVIAERPAPVPLSAAPEPPFSRPVRAGLWRCWDWTTVLPADVEQAGLDLLLLADGADISGGAYLSARRWLNHFSDLLPTIGLRLETVSIRDQDWTELRRRCQAALSKGTLPAFLIEFGADREAHRVVAEVASWLDTANLRALSAADAADLLSRELLSRGSTSEPSRPITSDNQR